MPFIFLIIAPTLPSWILKTFKCFLSYFNLENALQVPEYVHSPSSYSREEPWAEVSRRVDWIAAVQTHGHSDGHDDQANAERLHALWSADVLVRDGQDAQDRS